MTRRLPLFCALVGLFLPVLVGLSATATATVIGPVSGSLARSDDGSLLLPAQTRGGGFAAPPVFRPPVPVYRPRVYRPPPAPVYPRDSYGPGIRPRPPQPAPSPAPGWGTAGPVPPKGTPTVNRPIGSPYGDFGQGSIVGGRTGPFARPQIFRPPGPITSYRFGLPGVTRTIRVVTRDPRTGQIRTKVYRQRPKNAENGKTKV